MRLCRVALRQQGADAAWPITMLSLWWRLPACHALGERALVTAELDVCLRETRERGGAALAADPSPLAAASNGGLAAARGPASSSPSRASRSRTCRTFADAHTACLGVVIGGERGRELHAAALSAMTALERLERRTRP